MSKPSVNDYKKIIGEIAIKMNLVEAHMRRFSADLIGNDYELSMRVMAGATYTELLRLLKRLFVYRVSEPTLVNSFEILASDLSTLNDKRGTYIHSEWELTRGIGRTPPKAHRMKYSPHKKMGLHITSRYDEYDLLKEFSTEIDLAIDQLTTIRLLSLDRYQAHKKRTANSRWLGWYPKTGFTAPIEKKHAVIRKSLGLPKKKPK